MTLTTSILKGTDNNYETTSEMANGLGTDFGSEGVVGAITNTSGVAPMTGAFAVNEAGTPDMTVDVTAGTAYVTATPTGQGSQLLRVVSSATESVTINANSTGGTRYDWIYLQIDATNAAAPNSTGSNVASLVTQRSTTLATDSNGTPANSYAIAVVTVANGASSITNANITDKRANAGIETADGTVTPAKLAAFNRQNNTTNTTTSAPKIQYGWGYLEPGTTTNASETVTFPDEFTSAPIVIVSNAGVDTAGTPAAIGDFDTLKGKAIMHPRNVTTTSFTIEVRLGDATNFNSEKVGYAWVAIGQA